MNPFFWIRGLAVVSRREFAGNLRSPRMLIMALLTAIVVVGAAYGFSVAGAEDPFQPPPIVAWAHPAFGLNGSHVAVVWVSDPFGNPLGERPVEFWTFNETPEDEVLLGTSYTDASGFVTLDVNQAPEVITRVRSGAVSVGGRIGFIPSPSLNFTVVLLRLDLDRNGLRDDLGIHVLSLSGTPSVAEVAIDGAPVGRANSFGYVSLKLPQGKSEVEVLAESGTFSVVVVVTESVLPFKSNPDLVLLNMSNFSSIVIPLFAIAISFDAISKERFRGTLDLILSRPVSRPGVLIGKFLGAFASVAAPVTSVNLSGIAVISLMTGRSPEEGFAAAFLGLSLLLTAYYVLLQLALSTVAKWAGQAILYGTIAWILFTVLFNPTTFILGLIIFPGSPYGQFLFLRTASFANPTALYGSLMSLAAPETVAVPAGTSTFQVTSLVLAGLAWFVSLFILALWVFKTRAAR